MCRQCVSDGGSLYDIDLDLDPHYGEVWYRWMGQDIFYLLQSITKTDATVMAVAEFAESRSGETRGRPWVFTYHMGTDILGDNGQERPCK